MCKKQNFSHEKTAVFLSPGHVLSCSKKIKSMHPSLFSYSMCQDQAPYGLHKKLFILQVRKFFVL